MKNERSENSVQRSQHWPLGIMSVFSLKAASAEVPSGFLSVTDAVTSNVQEIHGFVEKDLGAFPMPKHQFLVIKTGSKKAQSPCWSRVRNQFLQGSA